MPYVEGYSSPIAAFEFERHANGERVHLEREEPEAYWALLRDLWASGGDFAIVEHDNVIHAGVLPTFTACPNPWCVFPYWGEKNVFRCALGCTRFRAALCALYPRMIEDLPLRRWDRLDSQLATFLHRAGLLACEHEPLVEHVHDYTRRPPRIPRGLCQRFPGGQWV